MIVNKIALLIALTISIVTPSNACAAETAAAVKDPDAIIKTLKEGNDRYMRGVTKYPRIDAVRRRKTAEFGQTPQATILGCADARVPPEVIFDQGFGDLFVVRVAGNVCAIAELASIEYGVKYLKTSLIVVLGHTECGAIKGALSDATLAGSLPKLIELIRPGIAGVAEKKLPEAEALNEAITANVWNSVDTILRESPGIANLIKEKKVKVVGAVRDIKDGHIIWLGERPTATVTK